MSKYLSKSIISLAENETFKIKGASVSLIDMTECDFDFKSVKIKESHLREGLYNRYGSENKNNPMDSQEVVDGIVFSDSFKIAKMGPFDLMAKVEIGSKKSINGRNTLRITYLQLVEN
jgi:hypothetical protein